MDNDLRAVDWVFILISRMKEKEEILGIQIDNSKRAFLPVFKSKEDALACLPIFPKQQGMFYEPNAILYEDLCFYAITNNYDVCFFNETGRIEKKIQLEALDLV